MARKPQIYEIEIKRQFLAHGDYSSIVHLWTNISAIFEEFFGILDFYFKIHAFIHSTFSRGTRNDILRNLVTNHCYKFIEGANYLHFIMYFLKYFT